MKSMKNMIMRAAMMLLISLTTSMAWAAQPDKVLDECYGVTNGIFVRGWTYDSDAPTTSIDVHVYVYTDAACQNQYGEIRVLTANIARPDVNQAKGIAGDHGFDATVPIADAGTYWVKLFAIDTNGNGNPQIGATTQVTVSTTSTNGVKSLPYSFTFVNDMAAEGWSKVNCYSSTRQVDDYGHDGRGYFIFTDADLTQHLISPEFEGQAPLTLMFYYRSHTDLAETFQVGYSTTTKEVDAFRWSSDIVAPSKEWAFCEQELPVGTKYFALRHSQNSFMGLYVDDFTVVETTSVPVPMNVKAGSVSDNEVNLTWTMSDASGITGYAYQYKLYGTEEWSYEVRTAERSVTLGNLKRNTNYQFRVRAFEGNKGSRFAELDFSTSQIPFDYSYGFETSLEDEGWFYEGEGEVRPDFVNSGNYSLYVTGVGTRAYLISPRLSGFPVTVSFYTAHMGRSSVGFYVGYSTTTSDIDAFIWDNNSLRTNFAWEPIPEKDFPLGTKFIAIKTDRLEMEDRSFFIDDISIKTHALPIITVDEIARHEATLAWTMPSGATVEPDGFVYQYKKVADAGWSGEVSVPANVFTVQLTGLSDSTPYQFRLKPRFKNMASDYSDITFTTDCEPKSLPYENGFEDGLVCWSQLMDDFSWDGIRAYQPRTGQYCYRLSIGNGLEDPDYLISPEFAASTPIEVSFYYRTISTEELFQIGYSTTTNDPSAFTWFGTVSVTNTDWELYDEIMPAGTKYVALKYITDHVLQSALLLDDFSFRAERGYRRPEDVTTSMVTDVGATLSWSRPDTQQRVSCYSYQYKAAADGQWSEPTEVTSTSVAIEGLAPNTSYQFRVLARYADGQESIYSNLSFSTTVSLPYAIGFENGMDRWSVRNGNRFTGIKGEAAHDGGNSFLFENSYSATAPIYLISPRLPSYLPLIVSFYYREQVYNSGYLEKFQVGYSTTTGDLEAFSWGQEIVASTNPWGFCEETVPLGTTYIAVRFTSLRTNGLYVDDFSIDVYSAYPNPTDLAAGSLTDESATVAWTAPDAGVTGYIYQYKALADANWSAETRIENTNSVTLEGLLPNTTYEFRIKACYGNNTSNFTSTRFLTEGSAVTSLPFNEGFENGMGGWRSGNFSKIFSKNAEDIHAGNHSFSLNQDEMLVSPRIDVSTSFYVSFYYKHFYGTYYQGVQEVTGELPAGFQVGYSMKTNDPNDFVWVQTIGTAAEWKELSFFCLKGTKYIAIRWRGGYTIYLDDFSFTEGDLPSVPQDLAATNITFESAELSWEGNSTRYDVRIREKPMFFEGFENGLGEWKIVNGPNHVSHTGIDGQKVWKTDWNRSDFYEFVDHGEFNHSGSWSVMTIPCYIYDDGTYEPYNVDTWLISPRVKLDGILSFWAIENMNYDVNYEVRVSTTTSDISAFNVIVAQPSHRVYGWREYAFDLTDYQGREGYIAFHATGEEGSGETEGNFLCIDDIAIVKSDWTTVTTKNNDGFSVFGLRPDTEYEFQVRSNVYSMNTDWSEVFTFTTNRLAPIYDNRDNNKYINEMVSDTYTYSVMLVDRTLYKDGGWNTLCLPFGMNDLNGTPLDGATVKTLSSTGLGNDGTLTLNFTDATGLEAGRPYLVKWDLTTPDLIIRSAGEWEAFASAVNNGSESFEGKFVQLGTDISVSTMAGTAEHPFRGTFDGAGYTLNVSINQAGAEYAAPFRFIYGATIRNLKVTGSVNGGTYSAGIVGAALGGTNSICNCWMAASVTGQTHVGGILGHGNASATTISNCFLSGSLTATNIGVLYGGGSNGGTHAVANCWASGTYTSDITGNLNLVVTDGGTVSVNNCRQNIGAYGQGTEEGIMVVVGEGGIDIYFANFLGSQWTTDDSERLALKHISDATNITSPVFKNVRVSNTLSPVETSYVDFIGITSPVGLTANDRSVLYLGANNTLYYPNANMTINSCRAYFQLKNGFEMGDGSNVKSFVLNFDGEETTGIASHEAHVAHEAHWFTLDGRKLDGKPTAKGLYIHGGRKVIVH